MFTVSQHGQQFAGTDGGASRLVNPVVYASPAGSDGNDGLSAASAVRTLGRALQILEDGWRGAATINLAAGAYPLGATPVVTLPAAPPGSTPLLIQGENEDSGLGARTAAAGSTAGTGVSGSAPVFATLVDSVGGLGVNAWRGYTVRFTSGVNAGRQYLVASNTATTFTLVGTTAGAAANGDGFVVERPAAEVSWDNGTILWLHCNGVVGIRDVRWDGGGTGLVVQSGGVLHQHNWLTEGISQWQTLGMGASLRHMAAAAGTFPQMAAIVQGVGCSWAGAAGALVTLTCGTVFDAQRSLFNSVAVQWTQGVRVDSVRCFHVGSGAWMRGVHGGLGVLRLSRMDGVAAPAPDSNEATGAVTLQNVGSFFVDSAVIENTTAGGSLGAAIVLNTNSGANLYTLSGGNNADVGVRIRKGSEVCSQGNNTVSGANGEIGLGSSGVFLWTDVATGPLFDSAQGSGIAASGAP